MKKEPHATGPKAPPVRPQSSLYLESTLDEQLGLLPGEARKVKHAMTTAVTVASPQTSLKDAAAIMKQLDVPVIVVYDGKRLAGMITERDMAWSHRVREASQEASIGEFMRTNVPSCYQDDLLFEVMSLMRASGAEWLPVLDREHHLIGILSRYSVP